VGVRAHDSIQVVAAAVRRLRKQRGWSQEKLAEHARLHRTYIGAIERCEENLTLRTLDKIAAALRVEPGDLFRRG